MVAGLGVQAWLNALDGHLVAADEVLDELGRLRRPGDPSASPYVALADFADAWVRHGTRPARPGGACC